MHVWKFKQEAQLSPSDCAMRRVSRNLCQLPRNSAKTTSTTNPEQIEVMKLKRYSKAMCNKHVHYRVAFIVL